MDHQVLQSNQNTRRQQIQQGSTVRILHPELPWICSWSRSRYLLGLGLKPSASSLSFSCRRCCSSSLALLSTSSCSSSSSLRPAGGAAAAGTSGLQTDSGSGPTDVGLRTEAPPAGGVEVLQQSAAAL